MRESFASRGGWWVVGQTSLMVAVVLLGALQPGPWSSRISGALGGAFMAMAGTLGIWGARALGRNTTAFPKPREGGALVQNGPYAIVRHPLYSSVILGSLGWGLMVASIPSLAATAVLTAFLNAKAAREERWLRATYPDYDAYARRVRRLVPYVL